MFDHVGIAVTDLGESERFYRTVLSTLGAEPHNAEPEIVEWTNWDTFATNPEHPVTHGLHVGFRAPSREAVDAFWQAGVDAGYRDDGAPGPRAIYSPDYYGAFLLDPDGNSAEAMLTEREDPVPAGYIDHLRFRVRDPAASRRFYLTIAEFAGLRLGADEPDHVQLVGDNFSFSFVDDGRPLTENVHLAFPAEDDASVRAFHAAALAAGYEDHGGPGERPAYHPGYYGAFVLDPDGYNVEARQPQPLSQNTSGGCVRIARVKLIYCTAALIVLAFVGCGSDDENSTEANTTVTVTQTATQTAPATPTAPSATTSETLPPDDGICKDGSGNDIKVISGGIACDDAAKVAGAYDQQGERVQTIADWTCEGGNAMTRPVIFTCSGPGGEFTVSDPG